MRVETVKIFVYGTFRPPTETSAVEDSRFFPKIAKYVRDVMPAKLHYAQLFDLGTFPAARPGEGVITGDLLILDASAIRVLDLIEGHPNFYRRGGVDVQTVHGVAEAWIYWAPKELTYARRRIKSGDWFNRLTESEADAGDVYAVELPEKEGEQPDPHLVQVVEQFANIEHCWISCVRPDRRAFTLPVRFVWFQGRIYIMRKSDAEEIIYIGENPGVVLSNTIGGAHTRIDGWAIFADRASGHIIPRFANKYKMITGRIRAYDITVEITPTKLCVWSEAGESNWSGIDVLTIWDPGDY